MQFNVDFLKPAKYCAHKNMQKLYLMKISFELISVLFLWRVLNFVVRKHFF